MGLEVGDDFFEVVLEGLERGECLQERVDEASIALVNYSSRFAHFLLLRIFVVIIIVRFDRGEELEQRWLSLEVLNRTATPIAPTTKTLVLTPLLAVSLTRKRSIDIDYKDSRIKVHQKDNINFLENEECDEQFLNIE
jgi:hypothetical protein